MIVAEMPLPEFFAILRRTTRDQGYLFLIFFVAREADSPALFTDLENSWASLHDLTGDTTLFVTVDGSDHPLMRNRQLIKGVGYIDGGFGLAVHAPHCQMNGTVNNAHMAVGSVTPWVVERQAEDFVRRHVQPSRRADGWRDQQSLGVSALASSLTDTAEDDVPCLVVESLQCDHSFKVALRDVSGHFSVYKYLKQVLAVGLSLTTAMQQDARSIRLLEDENRKLSPPSKKVIESREWLSNWLEENLQVVPDFRDWVVGAINGQASLSEIVPRVPRGNTPLRSHLNRVISGADRRGYIAEEILKLRNRVEANLHEVEQLFQDNAPQGHREDSRPSGGKRFAVALSFPGEHRQYVNEVATSLADSLGKERVFYDRYYESELCRPNLDTYLQSIYGTDSELVVVFLCKAYSEKEWCGLEWRSIRDRLKRGGAAALVFVRLDDGDVDGVFSIDGYIDASKRSADDVARMIVQRLQGP
jgi:hypothetical protein